MNNKHHQLAVMTFRAHKYEHMIRINKSEDITDTQITKPN